MKLSDLEPQFLKIEDERTHRYVDALEGADGIMFMCPKCFETNKGREGTHMIICWQPHVGQEHFPRPGRWKLVGTGVNDLTLVAGSSSVLLPGPGGCQAHFFVRNGEIQMC